MWLATGNLLSLVEDAGLWGRECSIPLPSGSGYCTCDSLPLVWERGLYTAGQLSFVILSILCSVSGPGCALEPFAGKFSLFCSLPGTPQFGLLSYVFSLRLSSRHSGPVFTLSIDYAVHTSLFSPRLLMAEASVWGTSPLLVAVGRLFCNFFFCFSLLVMLLSEIPKLPTDLPVGRGFPAVWKLLLQDTLLRMDLSL